MTDFGLNKNEGEAGPSDALAIAQEETARAQIAANQENEKHRMILTIVLWVIAAIVITVAAITTAGEGALDAALIVGVLALVGSAAINPSWRFWSDD